MAKTDQYPEPRRAVPINFLRPSRTSKLLTPSIVFVTLVVLATVSITGIIVAASVFDSKSQYKAVESPTQVLLLIAASISVVYLIVHGLAVLENKPIEVVRPPRVRTHGYCFIAARLGLISWMITLIASCVVASKSTICVRWNRDCKLQVLDVVCASVAFIATGVLLTALESCNDPFATPEILHVPQKITCRVSSFGNEFFDQSRRTSLQDEESISKQIQHLSSIEQREVDKSPSWSDSPNTPLQSVPGEFPRDQPQSPRKVQKLRVRGWGEEWTHLVHGKSSSSVTREDSSYSISTSSSSNTNISDQSSNTSISKGSSRNVTPSSSIRNLSRRSKLSTMRSIEFPDIPIPTNLRYLPPVIAPPHEWNLSKTASLTQLLPVADAYYSPRRISGTPAPLRIMNPIPAAPEPPVFAPKFKRTTLDVQIPGAFVDYQPPTEDSVKTEEKASNIEKETIFRVQPQHRSPVRLPAGEFEMHYAPNTLDSRTRYRQHKRVQASSIYSGTDSAVFTAAATVQYRKPSRTVTQVRAKTPNRGKMRLKRLSLGNISTGLGKLWED